MQGLHHRQDLPRCDALQQRLGQRHGQGLRAEDGRAASVADAHLHPGVPLVEPGEDGGVRCQRLIRRLDRQGNEEVEGLGPGRLVQGPQLGLGQQAPLCGRGGGFGAGQHAGDRPVALPDALDEGLAVRGGIARHELEPRAIHEVGLQALQPGAVRGLEVGEDEACPWHLPQVAGQVQRQAAAGPGDPVHAAGPEDVHLEHPAFRLHGDEAPGRTPCGDGRLRRRAIAPTSHPVAVGIGVAVGGLCPGAELADRHADLPFSIQEVDVVARHGRVAAGIVAEADMDMGLLAHGPPHDQLLHEEGEAAPIGTRLEDEAVRDLEGRIHHAGMQAEGIAPLGGGRQRQGRQHLLLALEQGRDRLEAGPVVATTAVQVLIEALRRHATRAARPQGRQVHPRRFGAVHARPETHGALAVQRQGRASIGAAGAHGELHRAGVVQVSVRVEAQHDLGGLVDDHGRHPHDGLQAHPAISTGDRCRRAGHLEIGHTRQQAATPDHVVRQEALLAREAGAQAQAAGLGRLDREDFLQHGVQRGGEAVTRGVRKGGRDLPRRRDGPTRRAQRLQRRKALGREGIGGQTGPLGPPMRVQEAPVEVDALGPHGRDLGQASGLDPAADQALHALVVAQEARQALGALPGRGKASLGAAMALRDEGVQGLGQRQMAVHDEGHPACHGLAAHLQGVGQAVERGQLSRLLCQEGEQLGGLGLQPIRVFRRQRNEHRLPAHGGRLPRDGLGRLHDQVHIRAADAEGAQRGATPPARLARGPGLQGPRHEEGRLLEVDGGVGHLAVDRRRDFAVRQAQGHLDAARETRHGVQMPDIGFHRADGAELPLLAVAAIDLRQGRDLHRVSQLGPGAMRFHVADGLRVDACGVKHLLDDPRLAADARCVETDLVGAIVVDGDAAQQGVDVVAVRHCIPGPLQHQDDHPLAWRQAAGLGVEGAAMAIAGQVEPGLVDIADARLRKHRGGSNQGMAALARAQGLGRQSQRHRTR